MVWMLSTQLELLDNEILNLAAQQFKYMQKTEKYQNVLFAKEEVDGPRTQDNQTKDYISDELDEKRRTQNI